VTIARALLIAGLALGVSACGGRSKPLWSGFGGDPARGLAVINQAQCGACHVIPGVPDAHGLVGPPLTQFGQRTMVAGLLPNTPDNLIHWLRDPQSVTPGNAMPSSGWTEAQARDAAAYLYTLR
jgi:cytochrome c